MPGRLYLGPHELASLRDFGGGKRIVHGFALGNDPWAIAGVVCVGDIDDEASMASALEAGLRGADLAVTVGDSLLDDFFDDAERGGIRRWDPEPADGMPEWATLLEALARGASVAVAARSCHISLRSAYRRLGEARDALEVSSTTAAVARWARQRGRVG